MSRKMTLFLESNTTSTSTWCPNPPGLPDDAAGLRISRPTIFCCRFDVGDQLFCYGPSAGEITTCIFTIGTFKPWCLSKLKLSKEEDIWVKRYINMKHVSKPPGTARVVVTSVINVAQRQWKNQWVNWHPAWIHGLFQSFLLNSS